MGLFDFVSDILKPTPTPRGGPERDAADANARHRVTVSNLNNNVRAQQETIACLIAEIHRLQDELGEARAAAQRSKEITPPMVTVETVEPLCEPVMIPRLPLGIILADQASSPISFPEAGSSVHDGEGEDSLVASSASFSSGLSPAEIAVSESQVYQSFRDWESVLSQIEERERELQETEEQLTLDSARALNSARDNHRSQQPACLHLQIDAPVLSKLPPTMGSPQFRLPLSCMSPNVTGTVSAARTRPALKQLDELIGNYGTLQSREALYLL